MIYYLAARYSRREEILQYKADLEQAGHVVQARWLAGDHQISASALAVESATHSAPIEGAEFALEDCEDLLKADVVISFTETPRSGHFRGGRHVEFGLAVAWGKTLIIIGPRENVFHCLPSVQVYSDWVTFRQERLT